MKVSTNHYNTPAHTFSRREDRTRQFKLQGILLRHDDKLNMIKTLTESIFARAKLDELKAEREVYRAERKAAKKIRLAELKKAKKNASTKIQTIARIFLAKKVLISLKDEKQILIEKCNAEIQKKQEIEKAKQALTARKRAKRERQKKAKKAAKAKAATQTLKQSHLVIAASDEFKAHCVKEAKESTIFNNKQLAFLNYICESRLPLVCKYISHLPPYLYKIIKDSITRPCSTANQLKIYEDTLSISSEDIIAVHSFILEQLKHFSPPCKVSHRSIMSSSELLQTIRNFIQIFENYKDIIPRATKVFPLSEKYRDIGSPLLKWPVACNNEINNYIDRIVKIPAYMKEKKLTLSLIEEISQSLVYKGNMPFGYYVRCCSIVFLSDTLRAQRNQIHQKDTDKDTGILTKMLETVILPRLKLLKDFKQLDAELQDILYKKQQTTAFGKALEVLLDTKVHYHQELLSLTIDADDKYYRLISDTLIETYAAGGLSKWTRVLPLAAAISSLAQNPELDLLLKKVPTEDIQAPIILELLLIKIQNLEGEDFADVLNKNGREKITVTKSAHEYAQVRKMVSEFCDTTYAENLMFPEAGALDLLKGLKHLVTLQSEMQKAGI